MPSAALKAHSLAEAYLYLMATPCPGCSHGPLRGTARELPSEAEGVFKISIPATCAVCNRTIELFFDLHSRPAPAVEDSPAIVNPTDEPSQILDVGQWIMLFRMIVEAASKESNKPRARHLGLEAAQCLEEALKFYDDAESDLPPAEAVFHEASRERFRTHPEQFSRERLLDWRAKLPTQAVMRSRIAAQRPRRRWRRGP